MRRKRLDVHAELTAEIVARVESDLQQGKADRSVCLAAIKKLVGGLDPKQFGKVMGSLRIHHKELYA